ncbi:MAG: DUF1343 domain-containing protein [Firmicutes bacterium]|nr:DUF1343 domain-containing protein [Bacillota bacterium]
MRKFIVALLVVALLAPATVALPATAASKIPFKLGNEVLFERYFHLIEGKRVGLVTNPTGVNSKGEMTSHLLAQDPRVDLVALFGPEHGYDGKAAAGDYVKSYIDPDLGIHVYSLYGETRRPTADMLKGIEVLLFDIQDIGARSYTYISTMFYVMQEAKKYGIPVVILDRPNPVGGEICEGPVLEEFARGFVGIDNIPIAHGMTVGELARFFNRRIGATIHVVPMEGYTRDMIWQDTGLDWVPTSPMIPTIQAAFGYNATGLGSGTGIRQRDYFSWIGGKGIDSKKFAAMLNSSKLPGVVFIPEDRDSEGGVRLQITDYHAFNPTRVNIHALTYAQQLIKFPVPKSGNNYDSLSMFAKIMGGNRMGEWLKQGLTPQQIEARYAAELNQFKKDREPYLIYGYLNGPGPHLVVDNTPIYSDVAPFIDKNNRAMVPFRALAQALGANVHWDGATRTVVLRKDRNVVVLTVGQDTVRVNDRTIKIDTVPIIRSDRTMIPVRHASELLGAFVHWDQPSSTVIVTTR